MIIISVNFIDFVEFSKWWMNEFKNVKFPAGGTVFDYYIDSDTKQFTPWTEKITKFELDTDVPLQVQNSIRSNVEIEYLLLFSFNNYVILGCASANS